MEKSCLEPIKVSVCISVHNTAKYLPRCLDSVCAQTLQSLEIVIVNNGSTDNSEDIMRDYALKYPERKFVIISQEDRSLAGGRQSGIDNASGEYLAFLDADDFVVPDAYEKMLECVERERVDMVEVETVRDGIVIGSKKTGLHNTHDILRQHFLNGGIQSMLWLRLYRKELFEKPVLPTLYTNNEDMFAMPCLLHAAKNIYFLNEPLHTYSTDNEGGVMLSEANDPRLTERRFNSKSMALNAIPHFHKFVGDIAYKEYEKEHSRYTAVQIIQFLLLDFKGKTMKDKNDSIKKALGFKSTAEIRSFLHQWLPKNSYIAYKLFGINIAFQYYRLINNFIKR